LESIFQINPQLDIPIYQQLVDKIRSAVKKGTLVPGQQLPTVQEMANQLSIAKGTIKRAYDELEHQGLIEKAQGRGTFICYQPAQSGNRKEAAMAAIDAMLDQLEEMGFSATEIGIFLTLKQRERFESLSTLKVAVLECNSENLAQLAVQMRRIKGIELYSYLLDGVQEYPYTLDDDVDMVVTTCTHAEYVESILSDRKKLAKIALRLSMDTLSGVVGLRPGDTVGILCSSNRFGDLLYTTCRNMVRSVAFRQPRTFSADLDMEAFLADKDAVLVPKDFERYCSGDAAQRLQSFEKRGKLIRCSYEMDEGSFLLLEEKLRMIRDAKTM